MTKPMKVKAFLIACILLATVVFSPLPTCTARELGGPGGYKPLPNKPPFNCGRGNRYCVRPAPKQRPFLSHAFSWLPLSSLPCPLALLENWPRRKVATVHSTPAKYHSSAVRVNGIAYRNHQKSLVLIVTAVTVHPLKNGTFWSRSSEKPKVEKQIQNFVGFSFCLPLLVILSGVTKPSLTSKAFFLFVSCLVPEKFQGN
uniref:Uncharacterized protein n=1 Tax=Salix viminalis TaxID=40686 RepID=A0A6N2LQB8_SALVM